MTFEITCLWWKLLYNSVICIKLHNENSLLVSFLKTIMIEFNTNQKPGTKGKIKQV